MAEPRGDDSWWDQSWNPSAGCRPASAGCSLCYAPRLLHAFHENAVWRENVIHADVIDHVDGSRSSMGGWSMPRQGVVVAAHLARC
jgi:protein gp37